MVRLELIEFENKEKLLLAVEKLLVGAVVKRKYTNKENKEVEKIIISKNRLYLGNNVSIHISQDKNGKVYLSCDYLSFDDRVAISKLNKEGSNL